MKAAEVQREKLVNEVVRENRRLADPLNKVCGAASAASMALGQSSQNLEPASGGEAMSAPARQHLLHPAAPFVLPGRKVPVIS